MPLNEIRIPQVHEAKRLRNKKPAKSKRLGGFILWAQQGLNLRPHPCEGCALPLSYAPVDESFVKRAGI